MFNENMRRGRRLLEASPLYILRFQAKHGLCVAMRFLSVEASWVNREVITLDNI